MFAMPASLVAGWTGAGLAIVLYVAAYFSFLRTLKYPRNWVDLSVLIVLPTVGLVTLMLLHVSLSNNGIDVVALLVTAGFVGFLFYIVAAPAIAFKPASRLTEFLARHGEYAGLWMLPLAGALSYAVPNNKLHAIFVAAMAIELAWSIGRLVSNRRRPPLHPIVGRDLAVLEMQAAGDLEAFAKRHGIRELAVADGLVTWSGCDKTTSPCPFNLYVNRLGLNTAPCCRERMEEICHTVSSWLTEMGVVHWLEGGTLLGAVRENGQLLPWEDDVDVSVLIEDDGDWDVLVAGFAERAKRDGYFVDTFRRKALIGVSHAMPRIPPLRWENYRLRGEVRLDLAVYRPATSQGISVIERQSHKGDMPATDSGGYGVPSELVLPTSKISFLGRDLPCPRRAEDYLRVLYGDFNEVDYSYVDAGPAKARQQLDAAATSAARENRAS